MFEIEVKDTFAAAHRLEGLPQGHPCSRLHGHTYRVKVRVRGSELRDGMLVEFGCIKGLIKDWDHEFLNAFLGHPTCEELARLLWSRVRDLVPEDCKVQVEISESDSTCCRYGDLG